MLQSALFLGVDVLFGPSMTALIVNTAARRRPHPAVHRDGPVAGSSAWEALSPGVGPDLEHACPLR
jgi:hypothetical protein